MGKYSIGLDYGTSSVRALIVDTGSGQEVGTAVWDYARGEDGVLVDAADPDLARQHPVDYLEGLEASVSKAMAQAEAEIGFKPVDVIGIGVDTTGSTPLPVDVRGEALGLQDAYADNLSALTWLWKDHTGHAEAAEITERAASEHPEYLAKCGGTYFSS